MARWVRRRYGLRRGIRLPVIPKIILLPILLLFLVIYLFHAVENNLKPSIIETAETRAHLVATEAIHRALYEKVLADVDYNDLIFIHKDTQQRITMMQANTIKINRIVSEANLEIKQALRNLPSEAIQIPLGGALGSQLLAFYGPKITLRFIPVGSLDVKFIDQFQQAGINQVRHILYLDVKTTVKIVVPMVAQEVTLTNQIPIAETIIVGQVPNTYLGSEHPLASGLISGDQPETSNK